MSTVIHCVTVIRCISFGIHGGRKSRVPNMSEKTIHKSVRISQTSVLSPSFSTPRFGMSAGLRRKVQHLREDFSYSQQAFFHGIAVKLSVFFRKYTLVWPKHRRSRSIIPVREGMLSVLILPDAKQLDVWQQTPKSVARLISRFAVHDFVLAAAECRENYRIFSK